VTDADAERLAARARWDAIAPGEVVTVTLPKADLQSAWAGVSQLVAATDYMARALAAAERGDLSAIGPAITRGLSEMAFASSHAWSVWQRVQARAERAETAKRPRTRRAAP
jgi:hypothetical protein